MKKIWPLLLLFACEPVEVPDQNEVSVTVKPSRTEVEGPAEALVAVFTYDVFPIGNPPDATFHSIDFVVTDGQYLYPICQLRMGHNELYQASADSTTLWIVQKENGYAYMHSYLNLYKLEKFTFIYHNGYCFEVPEGIDNRQRIPHFFGYNPITTVVIEASEYQ